MAKKMLFVLLALGLLATGCAGRGILAAQGASGPQEAGTSYTVVDTGQRLCYDDSGEITCPMADEAFYGQDAEYEGDQPSYTDNGDGTVTDNVTGLMWQQSPDTNGDGTINAADKLTYDEAVARASTFALAGYTDWRLPTIKELYSLILFDGIDPSGPAGTATLIPFLDIDYFGFAYGDTAAGERTIDAQFASSTQYVATTMGGAGTMFGVNFADGRIKGYGTAPMPGQSEGKGFFVLYVRGNTAYGENSFVDNGDGTITDHATGLTWTRDDSGVGLNWEEALAWVAQKNSENHLGYNDWRLPNVKELQSIVDYSRSPDTTGSAAIDPLFNATAITNEAGQTDYPFYWSSTTHVNLQNAKSAAYVAFGRALGYMNNTWMDVHGAGSQRSDPKAGDPDDYPTGRGPQGDAIRIYNYVRLVRGGDVTATPDGGAGKTRTVITVNISGIEQQPSNDRLLPDQSGEQGRQPPADNQFPPPDQSGRQNNSPPREAVEACAGLSAGAACEFTSPKGAESGVCEMVQHQLACTPTRRPADQPAGGQRSQKEGTQASGGQARYNLEQALSDEAQRNTIAFDALAFLTGNLGADSFFPPGKVADFWGFQYLRDNDPSAMGHNTDFLTGVALNVLHVLTPEQRAELVALAEGQVATVDQYAYNRLVLMDAFRRLLVGDLPTGSTGLDEDAIKAYSADLYRLDGEISYERAQIMGGILTGLDVEQRAYLDAMADRGMLDWPGVEEPADVRGLDRDVKVAVMTYAGDLFSWYAGSVEADVYFCSERQGTYFGSFYLKDAPAVGNRDYTIPTSLTGDAGRSFLETLTPDQASTITNLVAAQKLALIEIVDRRQDVSMLLRQFMVGNTPDRATVLDLMERYGELDGEIAYRYAAAFVQVHQTLTDGQQAQLMALRTQMLGDMLYPQGAYLYSQPIAMPEIPNTDFLFALP